MLDHSKAAFTDHYHHGLSCRYSKRALCPGPHPRLITATSEETNGDEQETTGNLQGAVRIDRRLGPFGRSATIESASEVETKPG